MTKEKVANSGMDEMPLSGSAHKEIAQRPEQSPIMEANFKVEKGTEAAKDFCRLYHQIQTVSRACQASPVNEMESGSIS